MCYGLDWSGRSGYEWICVVGSGSYGEVRYGVVRSGSFGEVRWDLVWCGLVRQLGTGEVSCDVNG